VLTWFYGELSTPKLARLSQEASALAAAAGALAAQLSEALAVKIAQRTP
jgi:hypothetical protein